MSSQVSTPVAPGPRRTCVGCRKVMPRSELVRLVVGPDGGVVLDPASRLPGRGAYICRARGTPCLSTAARTRSLSRALRVTRDRIETGALAAAVGALSHEEELPSPR
ncbi:MAG: YlxR family protein [Candidatus Dormibacteria bacterium]